MSLSIPNRWHLISIVLFALFCLYNVSLAIDDPHLLYDEAFNASVAKNIANGIGIATSYHTIEPLNPRLSTGLPALLPSALAIYFLGPQTWIPAIATLVLNLALLGILLQLVHKNNDAEPTIVFTLSILLFAFWYEPSLWRTIMGEISVVLFITLSVVLLYSDRLNSRTKGAAAGLCAGLAVLTKTLALVPISGFLCFFLLDVLSSQPKKSIRAAPLLPFLLTFLAVLTVWKLYTQMVFGHLSVSELLAHQNKSKIFFNYYGSGLGPFTDAVNKFDYILENASVNLGYISDHFRTYSIHPYALLVLFITFVIIGCATLVLSFRSKQHNSGLALMAAGFAHLTWNIFIANGYIGITRYLFFGVFFLFVGTMFILRDTRVKALPLIVISALLSLSIWSPNHAQQRFLSSLANSFSRDANLTAQFIRNSNTALPLVGCGWDTPRLIEYVLPDALNFRDCYLVLKSHLVFDENYYLAMNKDVAQGLKLGFYQSGFEHFIKDGQNEKRAFRAALDTPIEFAFVRNKFFSNLLRSSNSILPQCNSLLYENESYEILGCKITNINSPLAIHIFNYVPFT
ncbi:hypothetical protein [Halioxenophilus sp. WMMB6]|uniref:hypothetical protein n=1 Tax=Halioxenophilus sp. WMMB6 TaxID=3073815 RepID=UPI00295EE4B2|nr:hypothetical protein [Halioxenophilus sp. WMMB6]